jgi:hypothetical protein
MPKLLDFLKEKNISHEDAMKIIENYKPEMLTEEEKKEAKDKKQADKPETPKPETPAPPAPATPPASPTPEADKSESETEKTLVDFKSEVDKITKQLQSQLALLRGAPPKGVEADLPKEKPILTKNMFEVRI